MSVLKLRRNSEWPSDLTDFHVVAEKAVTAGDTDPNLALKTRRGTGYYKVPSLKGVWYRDMFGHSGWCATRSKIGLTRGA